MVAGPGVYKLKQDVATCGYGFMHSRDLRGW